MAERDARNRALGRAGEERALAHQKAALTDDGRGDLWGRTPFHISRNELAVAEERRADWCLMQLWNFAREPKAFQLRPPLAAHVSLTATNFQVSFH